MSPLLTQAQSFEEAQKERAALRKAISIANSDTYDRELDFYETDSYMAMIMCYIGTSYGIDKEATILGISLKDGILQSKEISLPATVANNGINYTVTRIGWWGEWSSEPKRSNTSENLELAVERIILPNTIEKIEFDDFERFKNLKMINTPSSLNTKQISVNNGNFNDECPSAYKKYCKTVENTSKKYIFKSF